MPMGTGVSLGTIQIHLAFAASQALATCQDSIPIDVKLHLPLPITSPPTAQWAQACLGSARLCTAPTIFTVAEAVAVPVPSSAPLDSWILMCSFASPGQGDGLSQSGHEEAVKAQKVDFDQ